MGATNLMRHEREREKGRMKEGRRTQSDKQRFLVLPRPIIQSHLDAVSETIAPQIEKLLERAQVLVEAQQSKLQSKESTVKILQSASIPPSSLSVSASASASADIDQETSTEEGDVWSRGSQLDGVELKGLDLAQIKKIKLLKSKRERLEKERVRLGLIEG
jgi:DASH complex subunit SPC19